MSNVADVQQVEASVAVDDLAAVSTQTLKPSGQIRQRQNLSGCHDVAPVHCGRGPADH
jgi:hypothetical protein